MVITKLMTLFCSTLVALAQVPTIPLEHAGTISNDVEGEGKTIYSAVRILKKNDQTLILFGVWHIGSAEYFDTVARLVHELDKKHSSLVVLDEFNTCDKNTKVLIMNDTSKATKKYYGGHLPHNDSPEQVVKNILQIPPALVQEALDSGAMKQQECVLDSYKNSYRHPQIVHRNQSMCHRAHELNGGCQWQDLRLSRSIRRIDSDTHLTEKNFGPQIIHSLMYGCHTGACDRAELSRRLQDEDADFAKNLSVRSYIHSYRDAHLIKKIKQQFSNGEKTVMVLWGAGHTPALSRHFADFKDRSSVFLRVSQLGYQKKMYPQWNSASYLKQRPQIASEDEITIYE